MSVNNYNIAKINTVKIDLRKYLRNYILLNEENFVLNKCY